ncbi:glycoside hydrolase family 18 [Sphingobacterium lactis]|uniref:glycoside hydrolase family 18 n=1 Tax=Sphingobacterium lactis TaxID=797291 RepID=UPI003F7D7F66
MMKKLTIKWISLLCLPLGVISILNSCKDWTDVESLKVEQATVKENNPALYAAYLADLKAFKAAPHKISIAWYNNAVKNTVGQADHINGIPDSLDFVVLEQPKYLLDREQAEMKQILQEKGIKSLYEINVDFMKGVYDRKVGDAKPKTFQAFLVDTLPVALSYSTEFAYQGIVLSFQSKAKLHLSADEQTAQIALEKTVFDAVNEWKSKHTDKEFIYKGVPYFVSTEKYLDQSSYVILPTQTALSKSNLALQYNEAMAAADPKWKIILMAYLPSLKPDESALGYFQDKSLAGVGTAEFVKSTTGNQEIHGVGLLNLQYDYYNILKSYGKSRQVIGILNPTNKK